MRRLTDNKIILVTRPTRVTELKRRFSSRMQAKFYVSHLGQDFSDYEREDEQYAGAVRQAHQTLDALGRVQLIDRSFMPNFVFGPQDVIVVLGQDGLVANTVKYLNGQPVLGVNPDPARWDGRLLPFRLPDLAKVLREPFPSKTTQASIICGRITAQQPLTLESLMPEGGVIFSDGIEQDFLEFRSGTRASVGIADKKGCLVI